MSYGTLFYLKYIKGISTSELLKRFPDDRAQVGHVALCDLPNDTLREILTEENELKHLIRLKEQYSQYIYA